MEAKSRRERKPSSVVSLAVKKSPRKAGKAIKSDLPNLVAGCEVIGRDLSVLRDCRSQFVWIDGTVSDFDEPKVLHQIAYKLPLPEEIKDKDEVKPTEWLCLADTSFTWADKPHSFPFANPTFSRQHTPQREEAVGKRVKIFWTTMGRWYQGIVEAYDNSTGMHRVRFKDGDKKHYQLAQEATVWLDIPALSSGTAIKKIRAEEGQISVGNLSNDENKPPAKPAETTAKTSNIVMSGRKKARLTKPENASPARKYTRRQHTQPAVQVQKATKSAINVKPEGQKPQPAIDAGNPQQMDSSKQNSQSLQIKIPPVLPCAGQAEGVNSTRDSIEVKPSGSAKGEPNGAVLAEKVPKLQRCLEKTKSASSSSEKVQQSSPKENESVAQGSPHKPGQLKCVNVKVIAQQSECDLPDGARTLLKSPAVNRKRIRAESINTGSTPKASQAAEPSKQVNGLGIQPPSKVVAGVKPCQKLRQPSRLIRNSADSQYADSCEAIKGSRISVWWPDYDQYYKGEVTGYTSSTKCLKVSYDDGYDQKKLKTTSLKFQWLSPRAVSAGATDKLHQAFKYLGAENVTEPVNGSEERSSVAVDVPVKMEAESPEGLHPSRPKIEVTDGNQSQVPSPASESLTKQSSQTAVQGLIVSQAPFNGQNGVHLASLVPVQGGLAFYPPNGLVPGSYIAHHYPQAQPNVSSIHGVLQAASYQLPTQRLAQAPGASQASSRPGQSQSQDIKSPSPLARSPAAGAAAYRKLQQATEASAVPQHPPQGASAVGWSVTLVFRGNLSEVEGRILAYDAKTNKHRILYKDGEDEWISIASENITWICENPKGTGYATGLPEGMTAPTGKDWEDWKIAVYWDKDDEFYLGTVSDPHGETEGLDQLKVVYNDGEERFENLAGLVFKYIDPPGSKGEDSDEDGLDEAPMQRSRKRGRESPDYQEEPEPEDLPYPTSQFRLPHLPSKGTSSIRLRPSGSMCIQRMASGRGSLLQFNGEDFPSSPMQSPLSPQQSMGFGGQGSLKRLDSRGAPVCVRKISGLRTAEGYRVDVKRVRIFLSPPDPSASQRSSKELHTAAVAHAKSAHGKGGDESLMTVEAPLNTAMPAKLKAMLERVEQAKENIRNGMPLETSSSALAHGFSSLASMASRPSCLRLQSEEPPSPRALGEAPINQLTSNAKDVHALKNSSVPFEEDKQEFKSRLSATPPPIPEHLTPPPSPFSGVKQIPDCRSPCPSIGKSNGQSLPSAIITNGCPGQDLEEENQSLSLPQTPSAKFEKPPPGPSRTGSDIGHGPLNPSPCCAA